ncbi:hypothetical protein JL722_13009 [Aureococcus anophagefferens]|nr:hypothetical protein JL722_13009 [Aureococcus anophagefferens]
MSKRITRFEANQPDWQITIQYVGTPSFERVPGVRRRGLRRARAVLAGPGRRAARAPLQRRFNGNGRRRCRYSMPFRWLTEPVWKMKTHFNELFNVYKDERIDLKTVRLSRKLGARRRGEELTDVGPCGKHLKDGDVLTLAPRDGTVCENLDEMECVTFQMGDGIYW